jgi:hypothetical protein
MPEPARIGQPRRGAADAIGNVVATTQTINNL